MTGWLSLTLVEDGDPVLPEQAFVFSGRYNEQFMFFDASGTAEEPSIYYYHIDEGNFNETVDSVFDVVEAEVKQSLRIQQWREKNK